MISRTTIRGVSFLLALAGVDLTVARAQQAQDTEVTELESDDTDAVAKLDLPEPDWSVLNSNDWLAEKPVATRPGSQLPTTDAAATWSEQGRSNGAAVSVKQSLWTFWDARI